MSCEEAANYLGIKLGTFRQNYSKKLDSEKVRFGKQVFFKKESLYKFLKPKSDQQN